LLIGVLLAAGLAACGGGGGSSASTASTATQAESTTPTSTSTTTPPAAKTGSAKPSPPRESAPPRALVRKAGHAAPFLVPRGDNSIPTYGAESGATQHSSATAALSAYLRARAAGDWSAACSEMAATVRKQLALLAGPAKGKAKGCAGAYAALSAHAPAAARANLLTAGLAALRVKGEKAFALFYGPRNQKFMMPMLSEGGAWKVNQIEPIPWPLGAPAGTP